MSYKEKPQLKLYSYSNNEFIRQAIIDDYAEASFEHNLYSAGVFTISINYNIPNSQLFQRGLFVQFGNNPYDFGEIYSIQDSIGEDGKGSQTRTITGYDARYILKRRVIKNMNSNGLWVMTAKGELCLRNLIKDQCGSGAEVKRQLPISNTIPESANAIGKEYSVSEQFTNLYEVCKTIATQSEIGWRIAFNGSLTLEVFEGENKSQTVRFDTNYESLANGEFSDSSESFSNAIYIGGKGQNDDRDIYEGENGTPSGFDRFESWDNQSSMTTESEYEAEALSMLSQYGQTLTMQGNGLAKCPYIFREQYDIGDIITVAFSGKSATAQILSVTEHWAWGSYDIQFSFGKPQNNLAEQLQLMLRQIQKASEKATSTDSVRWYTIPTDTAMPKADVTYNTIGFVGNCAENGSTFRLYWDSEKTGAKTYHVWLKQLGGGKLTLTTGKPGTQSLVMNSGTYVAIIYVDQDGNVLSQASTATTTIEAGNTQPVTSGAVSTALADKASVSDITNAIENLSASSVGGSGKYISAISETDGVISATASNLSDAIPNIHFTPRQINTPETITSMVKAYTDQSYHLMTFNVDWTEYESFPFAGASGYFLFTDTSLRCVGYLQLYSQRHYSYTCRWIDGVIVSMFQGWSGIDADWTRLVTFDSYNWISGKNIGNDKYLLFRFNGLRVNPLDMGTVLTSQIPSEYRPTSIIRGIVNLDLATGRVPCVIQLQSNGVVDAYPMLADRLTGSVGDARFYGDIQLMVI